MSAVDNAATKVTEQLREMGAEIEEHVVTNYHLADAIREGAAVSKQSVGWTDSEGGICALSAAEAAIQARKDINN